ncbi:MULTISPECIES: transporter substrate-binding domain-containing protein [unclassified Pseudomonas]|uniref:substrate-binding periplasmic protein n=1 Tax=unclassified Pseudomonas TaxID=196821 RepID=UPI002449F77D|nr:MULTISPECIES: transporter substrate-binding domain-containing protein [unclassified Pseudomonas]MDG9930011.1 transporter substrate-binding domain-containing protein [Pseudomonas sp. GD04042]MDH0483241.1 transporter substrate-binding domain-containing protein [Pseudomonas sp. GD04015]MDH0606828.1 transporter substrate-binding domain-containing protein [Pseudomonas sp. GD03869]
MPGSRLPALIALLASLSAPLAARGETLVIAADPWCPINCAADAERPGIFVELARDIFAEAGIEVRYETRNWARVLQQVRRGEINAAVGAGREDAPDFLFTDTPVALSRNCFYTLPASTWRYTGVDSLPGVRLGVINDYSYGELINAYVEAHRRDDQHVQVAAGDRALEINLNKLRLGRLDVVLENSWVLQAHLAARGRPVEVREAGCREPDVPIYLAFSPAREDSARYVELFERGLRRYRADGRLEALLRAYGVDL